MLESLLTSLSPVTNVWSFLAVGCVVVALVVVRLKVNRFKELLKRVEKFPEQERLEVVKTELNQVPPPNLSAEQYIKFRSQPYNFVFKCLIVLLIAGLVGMTVYAYLSFHSTPPINFASAPPINFAIRNVNELQRTFGEEKSYLSGSYVYDLITWDGLFDITNLTDESTTITDFAIDWGKVQLQDGTFLSLEEDKDYSYPLRVEAYNNLSDFNSIYNDPTIPIQKFNQLTSNHTQFLPIPFLAHEKQYVVFHLWYRIKHGTQTISSTDLNEFDRYLAYSLNSPFDAENQYRCVSATYEVQLTIVEGQSTTAEKISRTTLITTLVPGCVITIPK